MNSLNADKRSSLGEIRLNSEQIYYYIFIIFSGVFQSVRYRLSEDTSDVFVDGGLLCNYPIHAFDGK